MTGEPLRGLSYQRLVEAMDASEDAYWDFNPQTKEVFLSDRFYTLLGYRPGAFPMVLESWIGLIHPDDAPLIVPQFEHLTTNDAARARFEFRLKTESGGWRWILSRMKVMETDAAGRAVRISGTNTDITHRKLIEKALTESEARWTSLVDEAPVGVSLIGREGQILFVNRNQVGFPDTLPLGRNWKDFLPPDLHPVVDQVLDQVFGDGRSVVFETWRFLPDGTKAYFSNHTGPVREGGAVTAVVVVTHDVTEQRHAERQRDKASFRQRVLLELHKNLGIDRQEMFDLAVAAAVELTDSRIGSLTLYSEAAKKFTGTFWSGGTDQDSLADLWNEVVRQKAPVLATRDSSPFERVLGIPVFEQQALVGVVAVANKVGPYDQGDVTELQSLADGLWQLHRHREAQDSVDRLYQAVEHSPVALLLMDRQGTIEYANPRFYSMSGYGAAEMIGAQASLLRSGLSTEQELMGLDQAFVNGQEWQGEVINRNKSGDSFWARVSVSPIWGPSGTLTHFVEVIEDITERKAVEEMKAQALKVQQLMAQAQKMETVGQLAAGVAHDFNNLLTSVLAFNEMLLRKLEVGHPLRIYAEKIELSGRRAASLVAGLLAVGRQQRLAKVRIDLRELLGDNEALMSSLVKAPAEFKIVLGGEPLPVEVDPGQISQVVINLVSNAIDALGGEGTIILSAGAAETKAWLSVQDDGPGVPEELKTKIFDPFFTTKPIGKGTGLGLSIVQGIVQQHQGTIVVENAPVKGTRFTVWLPLAET